MSPEEELEEGRRQLGGIKILFWYMVVSGALGIIGASVAAEGIADAIGLPITVAIFIIALRAGGNFQKLLKFTNERI